VMNTGRQMYHWHTGTMSRRSTGLDSRDVISKMLTGASTALPSLR
jgi:predicted molibdopterin-dependent oxidoreductase YjgC